MAQRLLPAQLSYRAENGSITITSYSGPGIQDFAIPDTINGMPVTRISFGAFTCSTELTNLTIPQSVTNIGSKAFYYCSSLKAFKVDSNNPIFTSVDGVLIDKTRATVLRYPMGKTGAYTIPSYIVNIGSESFGRCTNLPSVTLPDSVTNIESSAFGGTTLRNVNIGNGVRSIGSSAFEGCPRLAQVLIGEEVVNIGNSAFESCTSLRKIIIPDHVVTIGSSAFSSCTNLADLTIGDNVGKIGSDAFSHCASLTNATMPSSVTSLEPYAFFACMNLTNVMGGLGITNLSYGVFMDCSNLNSIVLGKNLLSIGAFAFCGCAKLNPVTIPDNVNSIGDDAFYNCASLITITIPDSVTSLGICGFQYCNRLTNVVLGSGLTRLAPNLFFGCNSLTQIKIPPGITNLLDHAFGNCTGLKEVWFQGNAPEAGSSIFYGNTHPTAYYLPGTTGWADFSRLTSIQVRPWLLPMPTILDFEPDFGVRNNGFGFTISWATNAPVVVEACTNLFAPIWRPVQTNTLTDGTSYFTDSQWANHPGRFYRLRSP